VECDLSVLDYFLVIEINYYLLKEITTFAENSKKLISIVLIRTKH
jgi:hypothetical protein